MLPPLLFSLAPQRRSHFFHSRIATADINIIDMKVSLTSMFHS